MKHAIDTEWFHTSLRQQGKSPADLARFMSLDPSAVSRMLSGKRAMKAHEQDQIATFLNVPVEEVAAHRTQGTVLGGESKGFGERQRVTYEMDTAGEKPQTLMHHPLFGSMKGTTIVMPGVDLTEPADPDLLRIYDDDYDPQQLAVEHVVSDVGLSAIGKVWALDDLGLSTAEIGAALGMGGPQIEAAFAARKKARGW